jgi:hypothetical protein
MFSGEYRQGAERNALLTGLGNLPEALMVVEMSWGERDIYALLRVAQDNEADRRLSDWIDLMAGQRIYNRVQTGWVRYGSEMIRFVR